MVDRPHASACLGCGCICIITVCVFAHQSQFVVAVVCYSFRPCASVSKKGTKTNNNTFDWILLLQEILGPTRPER